MNKLQGAVLPTLIGLTVGVTGMLVMAGCVPDPTPAPVPPVASQPVPYDAPGTIYEDEPEWDCRTMGNRVCGVDIKGDWYLIQFDATGTPQSVTKR